MKIGWKQAQCRWSNALQALVSGFNNKVSGAVWKVRSGEQILLFSKGKMMIERSMWRKKWNLAESKPEVGGVMPCKRWSLASITKSGEQFEKYAQLSRFGCFLRGTRWLSALCDGRKNFKAANPLWYVVVAYREAKSSWKFQGSSIKTQRLGMVWKRPLDLAGYPGWQGEQADRAYYMTEEKKCSTGKPDEYDDAWW